jgi:hypothetical protein
MTCDIIDLDLFRMIRIGLFFVCTFLLCACSETTPPTRVYTGKDIEGYWATYTALHQSPLLSQMKNDTFRDFLRLYNDVNGMSDTVYKVHGDTLLLLRLQVRLDQRIWTFAPAYKIVNADRNRLVLKDLNRAEELTFYALADLPAANDSLINAKIGDRWTALSWNKDSIIEVCDVPPGVCVMWIRHPGLRLKAEERSFSRMSSMFARIKQRELPFANRNFMVMGLSNLTLAGNRYEVFISEAGTCTDPCVRAILSEMYALIDHYEN